MTRSPDAGGKPEAQTDAPQDLPPEEGERLKRIEAAIKGLPAEEQGGVPQDGLPDHVQRPAATSCPVCSL